MSDDLTHLTRTELESYVRTLEALDEMRERLMAALPACPDHGACVPYATAWIRKAVGIVQLEPDEVPQLSTEQWDALDAALSRE